MSTTSPVHEAIVDQLLELNQRLLDAIARGDWNAYAEICDPSLTCFEAEARGMLVEGLEFHKFYFDLGKPKGPRNNTIAAPHVRLIGSGGAVVSYVRLVQYVDDHGAAHTASIDETRVWEMQGGQWRHVHFHRSAN